MLSGHDQSFSRRHRDRGQNLSRRYNIYSTRKSRVSVPQHGNGCYVHERASQSANRSGKMARRVERRRMISDAKAFALTVGEIRGRVKSEYLKRRMSQLCSTKTARVRHA